MPDKPLTYKAYRLTATSNFRTVIMKQLFVAMRRAGLTLEESHAEVRAAFEQGITEDLARDRAERRGGLVPPMAYANRSVPVE